MNPSKQIQYAESIVVIISTQPDIYKSDYLRMKIFLYKKDLIENCEKNYKQTCSKQKIANMGTEEQWAQRDSENRVTAGTEER